ncbi:hypothetical protein GLYMA_05G218300v4 [Glycine max]|uniref:Uncharacterized protein n=2 Tax=Glycine subgen. Soja TaxID=1462606 RepID=I1K682_SOYBN|nr:uncharacterized protein LOC102666704 [Glycine max]XP_028233705.1 uncharacterized protein LOC114413468 [Glycine soja]KAG5030056.1 hypothetical protein JHK87_013570 [Glycine soja]KAG5058670.1 hypothetical protein JHK86_013666 [Glycine max]KAH1135690.1 hypothetical protein GYH30_013424 [Glycine max]KAH1135691.1 hypothetical protein GYH30_013424 [Glycine max]KRH60065.1 hypothetical protein GLYMA_05G218300v4 [Glycine max]|eukprot:XP_025984302.1 uncharacterized protein LOC102666704 [Glycine max]
MGNCSMKGTTGECHHSIRVMCDSGAILQLKAPKTVAQVLQHYPGYGIFRQGHASAPLPEQESLSYDLFYYLLPLKEVQVEHQKSCCDKVQQVVQRSEEMCKSAACDYVENLSNGSALEVLPTAKNGVWRVKLLIDPRQLEEILSEQVNTEALIEKMRMAATSCSTTSPSPSRSPSPTTSSKKVGWKTTLFNGKIAKDTIPVPAPAGSNLYLGSC